MLVATIDAQWEGMGDEGSARYEPALLPPCPTIRVLSYPSKHCSTGTIPAQYRGYCRNGTGPALFYCHLRNSDLLFCTSAFYRSGTGKLLPYRYQPAQLHYIASIIYVLAWCWASTEFTVGMTLAQNYSTSVRVMSICHCVHWHFTGPIPGPVP